MTLLSSDSNIFAGTSGFGVYRSTNNGLIWTAINNGLLGQDISGFAHSGKKIFSTTHNGIFLSEDNGENWTDKSLGLPNRYIMNICIHDTFVFVSPIREAIWRIPLSEMITSADQLTEIKPETFNLSQNYPNPFNPSTAIKYSVPNSSRVKIKVFDVLGKEVTTLVNEEKPAGNYEVNFDAAKLTSGVYFYRIMVSDFIQTKKMLLLK
jgi:hypothetical protein